MGHCVPLLAVRGAWTLLHGEAVSPLSLSPMRQTVALHHGSEEAAKMSGPQFMPLYIGDYLRDTAHLTTEQHGAYLLLICACWVQGGVLPDDDKQLAAITRLPLDVWRGSRNVLAKFFKISGKKWRQKRVSIELERALHLHEVRSKAGSLGGSKTKARARVPQPQPQLEPQQEEKNPLSLPSVPASGERGRGARAGFRKRQSARVTQFEGFYHAATNVPPHRDC